MATARRTNASFRLRVSSSPLGFAVALALALPADAEEAQPQLPQS